MFLITFIKNLNRIEENINLNFHGLMLIKENNHISTCWYIKGIHSYNYLNCISKDSLNKTKAQ